MPVIHIIEDDQDLLEMLAVCFEAEGFQVIADYNGDNFSANPADNADVYLVDIHLINKNGLDLVKTMKSNKIEKPVILLSASMDLKKIAGENQADDFIQKPFEMNGMVEKIKEMIGYGKIPSGN